MSETAKEKTEEFRVKAEKFSLENIHILTNEIKAEILPYIGKQSKKEGFTRIGLPFTNNADNKKSGSIWDRI